MKANELRLGNFLLRPNGNIATVTWGVIKDIENGDKTYFPLQLGEGWLIRFSFKPFEDGWYRLRIGNNSLTWNIYDKMIRFNGFAVAECDYVHKFQNLIYALVGEELTNTEEV